MANTLMDELTDSMDSKIKEATDKVREECNTLGVTEREKLKKEFDTNLKEFKDASKLQIDAIMKNNVKAGVDEKEVEKFSFAKAFTAILTDDKDWKDAGYEKEVIDHAKSLSGNTGSGGGALIPIEFAKTVLEPAIADTVMKTVGARVLNGLKGDLTFPIYKDRPQLRFLADGTSQLEQDMAFGQKHMRPKTGGMLVALNNKLIMQSAGAAERIVREAMQDGISLGVDNISLNGTGSDSQPRGILNYASEAIGGTDADKIIASTALGTNGARCTFDNVARMEADIQEEDYMKNGIGALITHPRVVSGLRRERTAQYSGQPLGEGAPIHLNPLLSVKALESILGKGVRSTTNIAKNGAKGSSVTVAKLILGEWRYYSLGFWGGLRLQKSTEAGTAFASNQTWIVAWMDMDTMVDHAKAFAVVSDCETLESLWT